MVFSWRSPGDVLGCLPYLILMQAGTEFYTGAMYGVLDAIQNGHVNAETDHYHRNEPLVHEDLDHVSRALIETGHEPLVRMILGKAGEDDYCVFSEVVNG